MAYIFRVSVSFSFIDIPLFDLPKWVLPHMKCRENLMMSHLDALAHAALVTSTLDYCKSLLYDLPANRFANMQRLHNVKITMFSC